MSIKLLNIATGNTAQPIYAPTATEIELASSASLVAWLEGDAGFLSASGAKWHDRKTGKGYPVTGAALSAGSAINGNGALAFNGTNYATVVSGIPVGVDYSMLAVVRQRKTVAQGAASYFIGSPLSTYFSFGGNIQAGDANFRLGTSNNTTPIITGAVDHPTNAPCLLGAYWDQSTGTQRVYFGGTLEATSGVGRASVVDSTLQVGNLTGLAGSRGLIGDIAAVLIFNIDFNKAANATFAASVNAYLKTKYAV